MRVYIIIVRHSPGTKTRSKLVRRRIELEIRRKKKITTPYSRYEQSNGEKTSGVRYELLIPILPRRINKRTRCVTESQILGKQ